MIIDEIHATVQVRTDSAARIKIDAARRPAGIAVAMVGINGSVNEA